MKNATAIRRGFSMALLTSLLAAGVTASVAVVPASASSTPGAVYGWLDNDSGQLGIGTCCGHSDVFVAGLMPAGSTSIAVAAGQSHSLAVTSTGDVYAFGFGGRGQLGDGSTANVTVPVQSSMPAGVIATAVAAGWDQSLALTSTGAVYAWGYNANGQLGVGTTKQSDVPLLVHLPSGVVATAVAAGKFHSLALTSTGAVYAWGYNATGQLGNNSIVDSTLPVLVNLPSGVKATAIGAGDNHSLAVTANGSVYAWGDNTFGQLGNSSTVESDVPVHVHLPAGVVATAVVAGGVSPTTKVPSGDYSLARTSTGAVYAWGSNNIGQLGDSTTTQSTVPVLVHLPTGVFAEAISAGSNYAKALTSQGAIYYWGTNSNGNNQHLVPVLAPLPTGLGAVGIAAGPDAEHVIALLDPAGSSYNPLTPYRICDTRTGNPSGLSGTDGQCLGQTIGAGATLTVQVTGTNPTGTTSGGIPATGVSAVVLNVTVVGPSAPSYLTVWPAGGTQPTASNLNYSAGDTVANLVTVSVPSSGQVSLFNANGSADVVVDVQGYDAAPSGTAGLFNSVTPYRICDTRTGNPSALSGTDGQCLGQSIGAGATLSIQVTGTNPTGTTSGGIPATGVSAVVLNVTAVGPSASSYLTVWPAGATQPTASNLNFVAGQTVANRVIVPVSSSGQVSLFNGDGSTDVVVDVNGWFTDGSSTTQTGAGFTGSSPFRICDTRTGNPSGLSGANAQCLGSTIAAGATLSVQVTGVNPNGTTSGAVPNAATAVVLNVTVTNTTTPSFLTAWPTGTTQPVASDLNWVAGETVPNMVVVELGNSGQINLFNSAGSTDVVVDVMGWYQ